MKHPVERAMEIMEEDRRWARVMLRIFGWLTLTMLGVAAAMEVL